MSKFIVLITLCLCTLANSAPRSADDPDYEPVPIVKSEINKGDDGSYKVEYETGDGTKREESANIVDAGTDEEALEVKGSYKYIDDEGKEVEVFYTAGKNGFVPYGPSINAEITAVAQAAKNLPKEIVDEKPKQRKVLDFNN